MSSPATDKKLAKNSSVRRKVVKSESISENQLRWNKNVDEDPSTSPEMTPTKGVRSSSNTPDLKPLSTADAKQDIVVSPKRNSHQKTSSDMAFVARASPSLYSKNRSVSDAESDTSEDPGKERRWTVSFLSNGSVPATSPLLKPTVMPMVPAFSHAETQRKNALFAMQEILKDKLETAEKPILEWCREQVKDYTHPIISIVNLDSFKDGVFFLALIHKLDNSVFDWHDFDKSDPKRNLEAAFNIADKYLNIPNVLLPEMVIAGTEVHSVLLYISIFKAKMDEMTKLTTPLPIAQKLVGDIKSNVKKRIDWVQDLMAELTEETLKLNVLTTKDDYLEEKQFLEEKVGAMDKMVEQSRAFMQEMILQNKALREQVQLLKEKNTALEKMVEFERSEKETYAEQLVLEEKIRALGEMLAEPNIDQYIAANQEKIDEFAKKEAEKRALGKSRETQKGEAEKGTPRNSVHEATSDLGDMNLQSDTQVEPSEPTV